ncbi:hypothetical protein BGY98DRAFT_1016359 [Russula aff. rugulosa BPL654]|nr:hypothetical protein BGY98DRAFT_1016359 [Russula aff. rugulosa BPL654]
MTSSTYSINAAIKTGRFTNTWTSLADLSAGPGGAISSVIDLVPWVKTILNGGTNPDTNITIIPPAQFNVITSAHSIVGPNVSAEASTFAYGLGWFRATLAGHDVIWHPGGAPGVSTFVAAVVEDGIGIVALTNADTKADVIQNIVVKAAEKVFGFRNSSSPSSSMPATTVTRRSNIQLPRRHAGVTPREEDDDDLTGTYYNAGYGTGVLCSVQSTSPSCKSVLDAFRSIDPSLSPNSTSTDLFASWVTLFSTHIRLTYTTTNNSHYNLISAGSIYPQAMGKTPRHFRRWFPLRRQNSW